MNKRNLGNKKEEYVVNYLTQNGYDILEKNFYSRHGEIDIIARKDSYICFIEVKYRKNADVGMPEEAVSISKMKKICKTSQYYLYTHREYDSLQMRFDVAAVLGEDIIYYENTFSFI